MDIKVEVKEEPLCSNETLTEIKSEFEEIPHFHSETVFVSSHIVKDCANDSEIDCNKACNKVEIKEESCWSKSISNEIKHEGELHYADLQNEIKETASLRDGDVAAEEASRLHTESVCRNRDSDSCFITSTNSEESSEPDITKASQLLRCRQQEMHEELEINCMLDSDADNCSLIQNCEMQHKCQIYGQNFKPNTRIINHEDKETCEIRKKCATQASVLKSSSHDAERLYPCETCNKIFTRASTLKLHKVTHEGIRPYTCEICQKSFKLTSHLKQHKLTHEGKRQHECEVCNKSFARSSTLKQHKMTHEGKYPHKCEICCKNFTGASELKRHMLIHEGKRPHVCDVCSKSFTQTSTLKQHKMTHEGKRPYICNTCNCSFTRASDMKRHKLSIGH